MRVLPCVSKFEFQTAVPNMTVVWVEVEVDEIHEILLGPQVA
jgi:hypothetical protein